MERPAYETDAYMTTLDTEVIKVGEVDGVPYVVTADTIFYPEGGGQPADHGTLGGVAIVDVRKDEGTIRHLLESSVVPGPVRMELDWQRRFDHMQQHTAQHVLTTVAQRDFGWPTLAFHLGPSVSDIELDARGMSQTQLADLEDAAEAEIRAARPISVRYVEHDRMEELGVRSRLLPEGFEGSLRLVGIEGLDLNTCGGTHVGNTAEIGTVSIIGTEPMRGGTRIFWVAGDRVRRRMAEHEARNLELRTLLDSADADLPEVVAIRLEREKKLAGETRRLKIELATAAAEMLCAAGGPVVSGHWKHHDMAFLQEVGKVVVEKWPSTIAMLATGPRENGVFMIVAHENTGIDLQDAGAQVAAILNGRGGGRAPFFQGKATALHRLEEAAEYLLNTLNVQRSTFNSSGER